MTEAYTYAAFATPNANERFRFDEMIKRTGNFQMHLWKQSCDKFRNMQRPSFSLILDTYEQVAVTKQHHNCRVCCGSGYLWAVLVAINDRTHIYTGERSNKSIICAKNKKLSVSSELCHLPCFCENGDARNNSGGREWLTYNQRQALKARCTTSDGSPIPYEYFYEVNLWINYGKNGYKGFHEIKEEVDKNYSGSFPNYLREIFIQIGGEK